MGALTSWGTLEECWGKGDSRDPRFLPIPALHITAPLYGRPLKAQVVPLTLCPFLTQNLTPPHTQTGSLSGVQQRKGQRGCPLQPACRAGEGVLLPRAPTWGQSLDPRRPDSEAGVHFPPRPGLPQRIRSGPCSLRCPAPPAASPRCPPPAPSPSWRGGGPTRGPSLAGSGQGTPHSPMEETPGGRGRRGGGGRRGPARGSATAAGAGSSAGRGPSATGAGPSAAGGGAGQVGGGRSGTRGPACGGPDFAAGAPPRPPPGVCWARSTPPTSTPPPTCRGRDQRLSLRSQLPRPPSHLTRRQTPLCLMW